MSYPTPWLHPFKRMFGGSVPNAIGKTGGRAGRVKSRNYGLPQEVCLSAGKVEIMMAQQRRSPDEAFLRRVLVTRKLAEEVRETAERVHQQATEAHRLTEIARRQAERGRELSRAGRDEARAVAESIKWGINTNGTGKGYVSTKKDE